MTNSKTSSKVLPVLFFLTLCADQMSKFFATVLGLNIQYNSGISFGILSQLDTKLLTVLLCILIYFLFVSFRAIWSKNESATGLFFGGAVANLFDRFNFGAVRDWLPIPFTQIQNNVADWAIFAGIVLLIFNYKRVIDSRE